MEQLYTATFDHTVSGVSWKSGDSEYKNTFSPPIHLGSGDILKIELDPAPANGEYFVHVVVGDKYEIKGIVGFNLHPAQHWVAEYPKPPGSKLYPGSLKYHWAADYAVPRPALKRGIDKFDYLLEEA